ncbi:MAG: hypothetical protein GWP62_03860 [Gammaproteobacteria bacterium]|jgi:hypothetical protein|nr:hypothetical protein [Gammaproteobacteria bacterium]
MKQSDEKLAQEAKVLFDESVDELDAATLSTLNQSRQKALAELHAPPTQWLRWVPAAAMATAAFLVVTIILPGPANIPSVPADVTDMEILLGEDSIEMLEDLEFYAWIDMLEQENDVG